MEQLLHSLTLHVCVGHEYHDIQIIVLLPHSQSNKSVFLSLSFSVSRHLFAGGPGLLPQQNNVEELYAKVQKPRDRKKPAVNKDPPTPPPTSGGKEVMVNGGTHPIEDSSPPPPHSTGKIHTFLYGCIFYFTLHKSVLLYIHYRHYTLNDRLQFLALAKAIIL